MDDNLWHYATALYARPSVAKACLQLQDEWKVNINLLLFAQWLEQKSIQLHPERLRAALNLIEQWDEFYVKRLRQLRRQMKLEFSGRLEEITIVRDHIKKAELMAEQQELRWLENFSFDWSAENKEIPPGTNISFYLNSLTVTEDAVNEIIELLQKIN